jgi:opacity protein-like surface antigen
VRAWTTRLLAVLLLALSIDAVLGAGASPPTASPRQDRWTYWVDLGANFVGTTDVDAPFAQDDRYEVELKPGARIDLGIGYRPVPWLRVGFESGYAWNEMQSLLGFDELDGEITQVPVQGIVAIDHGLWGPLSFTIGAGAGGVYTRSSSGNVLREIDERGEPVLDLLWRDVGSNQFVAGYQGYAAITYELSRGTHLGLHYRIFGTERLDWTLEYWNGAVQTAQTDRIINHGVTAFFRADF